MDCDVIPRHGLGTAPLGGLFTEVSDLDAASTVAAAINCGIHYFDTAPQYGHGLAETRLGSALEGSGLHRNELFVSTKVGRILVPGADPTTIFHGVPPLRPHFDFSADGVRRSLHDSMTRLGLDFIDMALVHDPDDHEADATAMSFPTLIQLRDEGLIGAIGVGMNQVEMLTRFAQRADDIGLDAVLVAGRWTLLDRSAGVPGGLLDMCAQRGVRVIVGGVFNSGLLARPEPGSTFDYGTASPQLVHTAERMASVCHDFGVSLTSAALQFPWRHAAVSSVIVGARTAAEVQANAAARSIELPDALWPALDACIGDPR